jgi:hypothetical protein
VTHGQHTIKFGARARNDLLSYYTPANFNGTYTFATFAAYATMEQGLAACRSRKFKPMEAALRSSPSARASRRWGQLCSTLALLYRTTGVPVRG